MVGISGSSDPVGGGTCVCPFVIAFGAGFSFLHQAESGQEWGLEVSARSATRFISPDEVENEVVVDIWRSESYAREAGHGVENESA